MKANFIVALLFTGLITHSHNLLAQDQSLYYSKITSRDGSELLLGKCSPEALKMEPFAQWYFQHYQSYRVDTATCNFIRPMLKNKKLILFMGTWCGDSKREVPRILKMLECCNFNFENLELVMVSNQDSLYKQSPLHEERGRNIQRVPTLIIEEAGKETGRIIEFPVISLEKDLLSILRRENYIPNYYNLTGLYSR